MRDNEEVWRPLSITEIHSIFSIIPIQWWIAGGWALDIYLHKVTRAHEDIDIVILRPDHLNLQRHLGRDWEMFIAFKGQLIPWNKNQLLDSHYDNIWVKKKDESTWAFQVMLLDIEEKNWIYKRNNTIRKSLEDIGLVSLSGIPFLKPEIQLLYKGGSSVIREKDVIDLGNILPKLNVSNRDWLKKSLKIQYPHGHKWIELIDSYAQV
ncbi:nucleotidyltransferase domain-containing protein [Sutcliffiella horikoshii]|uniref:nucleotidyltransferase domain-containing protein n=1 Tax=Sutcliffiella horikoshii TaxID=79883 RepID=UPI003CF413D8